MKQIAQSGNAEQWPRRAVPGIECRKRDLVVRIADWSRQSLNTGEPAYDVEIYIGGIYDWHQSKTFAIRQFGTRSKARLAASAFAQQKISELL